MLKHRIICKLLFFLTPLLILNYGCKKKQSPYREYKAAVNTSNNGRVQFILMHKHPQLKKLYGSHLYRDAIHNFDIVASLIKCGVDLNKEAQGDGKRPLHLAAKNGARYVVMLLLKNGANISPLDRNGNLPIQLAAQFGHVKIFKLLMEKGAYSYLKTNESKDTFLHYVSSNKGIFSSRLSPKRANMIKFLVKNGVDINAQNSKGQTALHLASDTFKKSILVKTLIELGADKTLKDKEGKTALDYAKSNYANTRSVLRSKDIIDILTD